MVACHLHPSISSCWPSAVWTAAGSWQVHYPDPALRCLPSLCHIVLFRGGIAPSVKCLAAGWTAGIRFPTSAVLFQWVSLCPDRFLGALSLLLNASLWVKRPEHEIDYSPECTAEVENFRIFTVSPPLLFHGKVLRHRDEFTCTFTLSRVRGSICCVLKQNTSQSATCNENFSVKNTSHFCSE
jgi:hypothetical protein